MTTQIVPWLKPGVKTVFATIVLFSIVFACRKGKSSSDAALEALTQGLGDKAGTVDEVALASVHSVSTSTPPAALRPDPDLFARRLLRQFHPDDANGVKAIGSLEDFRPLLGGASLDFRTVPQETYDATSLLALVQVAKQVCTFVVNPNENEYPGWKSVLPYAPDKISENILFLSAKIKGMPDSRINQSVIDKLVNITKSAVGKGGIGYADYQSACTYLAIDAEALYL